MAESGAERIDTLGGRAIHWWEFAGAGPALVFANGCAMAAYSWRRVEQRLVGRRRVVFDRPGMAGTPWPGTAPTLAEEVATLAGLARRVGPVVLVAHSMAAFHAEALVRQHPDLVAGVVLVDPSVLWMTRPPRPRPGVALARLTRALASVPPLDWTGHFANRAGMWAQSVRVRDNGLAARVRERLMHLYRDPEALAMSVAEFFAFEEQGWDLMGVRAAHAWPGRPGVVLTALTGAGPDWRGIHERYGRMLGMPVRGIAESRHLMMVDRPDAVVRAIEEVLAQV